MIIEELGLDARRRADDALAERCVWCTAALPASRPLADSLRDRLAAGGVRARRLDLEGDEPINRLAGLLDEMLRGRAAGSAETGRAERSTYAEGTISADGLAAAGVRPGDVVIIHDPLAVALAHGARERGPHVVWQMAIGPSGGETVLRAWRFLEGYRREADAHLVAWPGLGLTAVMPAAGRISARRGGGSPESPSEWSSALADVVRDDRGETVGGTRHARPAVAIH